MMHTIHYQWKFKPRESKHPDNVLRVANYCFGSTSVKHPFLKEVIDECIHRLKYIIYNQNKHF